MFSSNLDNFTRPRISNNARAHAHHELPEIEDRHISRCHQEYKLYLYTDQVRTDQIYFMPLTFTLCAYNKSALRCVANLIDAYCGQVVLRQWTGKPIL